MACAIAVGYRDGPSFGLEALHSLLDDEDTKFMIERDTNYYASIADFAVKVDDKELATSSFERAIELASKPWQIEWLTAQQVRRL